MVAPTFGVCDCDAGWKGAKCGVADLGPAIPTAGYRNSSMATWGGRPLRIGQQYHLYGSAMAANCTLSNFATNSFSMHAVSDAPGGPYEFRDVALPPFHHSTTITTAPDGTLLIFAIGKNTHGANLHHCHGAPPDIDANASGGEHRAAAEAEPRGDPPPKPMGPHDYVTLSYSKSPDGPWVTRTIMQTDQSAPHAWNCNKSNPAPLVFRASPRPTTHRPLPTARPNS